MIHSYQTLQSLSKLVNLRDPELANAMFASQVEKNLVFMDSHKNFELMDKLQNSTNS